jgi:WhiB family transcriptional regulator, redox-sensing transcriptional regulator
VSDWRDKAGCREADPEVFFPIGDPGKSRDSALSVQWALSYCGSAAHPVCPVRETCLEYALSRREDDGVWGGMTATERTAIRRRRSREAQAARAAADAAAAELGGV